MTIIRGGRVTVDNPVISAAIETLRDPQNAVPNVDTSVPRTVAEIDSRLRDLRVQQSVILDSERIDSNAPVYADRDHDEFRAVGHIESALESIRGELVASTRLDLDDDRHLDWDRLRRHDERR